MKNDKVIQSWNRIGPDASADERMLKAVLERNHTVQNGSIQTSEGNIMKKFNAAGSFNMLRLMTAGIAICLCLAGVSVMTSAGGLNGFFRDITGKNNAIVSTAYENADEEISVSVSVSDDVLTVTMLPVDINAAPYKYIEQWNVSRWQLTDSEGTVIAADDPAEWAEVHDGTAEIRIPVPELKSGTYKLNITEFLGRKKADQDLPVRGNWECEFSH